MSFIYVEPKKLKPSKAMAKYLKWSPKPPLTVEERALDKERFLKEKQQEFDEELSEKWDSFMSKALADKEANIYFKQEDQKALALDRRARGEIEYKKYLARKNKQDQKNWEEFWAKKRRQRSMDRLLKDDPELYELLLQD